MTARRRLAALGVASAVMSGLFIAAGGIGSALASPQTCRSNPNCIATTTVTTTPLTTLTTTETTTVTDVSTELSTTTTTSTTTYTTYFTFLVPTNTSTTSTSTVTGHTTTFVCATFSGSVWQTIPCPP